MSALGINWQILISQLIGFIVLFGALILVAYKPILKLLDERSQKIKESLEQAEAVKEQSLHAEEEVKKQIQAASQQSQEIIARATKASDDIRAKAQDLAKQDAEALIDRARQAINTEREAAVNELRQEFADLTVFAAGKVIGSTLDKESHKELIDKVMKESPQFKKG